MTNIWLLNNLFASGFYGDGSLLLPANLLHRDERPHVLRGLDPTLLRVHDILLIVLPRRDRSPRQVTHMLTHCQPTNCNISNPRLKLGFCTLVLVVASWVEFYLSEVFTPCCGVKSKKVRLTMSEMIQRKMCIRNLQRIARKSKSRLQQRSGNQHR